MPIEEPTVLTISVLRGPTPHYEVYPGAEICDGALVTDSRPFLPDKAIDLVDEAASSLRLAQE